MFGGEIGPSGAVQNGKGKGKASEKKVVLAEEAEDESSEVLGGLDIEVEEESDDEEAGQSNGGTFYSCVAEADI